LLAVAILLVCIVFEYFVYHIGGEINLIKIIIIVRKNFFGSLLALRYLNNTPLKMFSVMTKVFNLLNTTGLFCNALCTGKEWPEKICEVRKKMTEKKAVGLVVTALDEIAWLLNLRGSDICYNPVFFAYVIVTTDSVMYVCYTLLF